MWIDDASGLSIAELSSRARRLSREQGGLSLVVVDYLQLITPGRGSRAENRNIEITKISQGLKALAKELDVPVVAASQLSRDVERRVNNRPTLSDLRESGSLEQDADVVMFVYRDEVYCPDTDEPGVAEIITAKFRNGRIGTDKLAFHGEYCRFADLARDYRAQPAPKPKAKQDIDY
jgi:replicative DNA helicase